MNGKQENEPPPAMTRTDGRGSLEEEAGGKSFQQVLSELRAQKFALDQHAIVSISDHEGRIIYANDRFCRISQYSREELLGQKHALLNSGYHPKSFFRDMWNRLSRGEVWQGEIRNRRKDGSCFWVDTTIVPFLDEQGRPYQYVSIRTDITERKRHEWLARERQARLREQHEAVLRLARSQVMQGRDLRQALDHVCRIAADTLGADRASIWLLDEARSRLDCVSIHDVSGNPAETPEGLLRHVCPDYFELLERSRLFLQGDAISELTTCRLGGFANTLQVPIRQASEVVGVLCIEQKVCARDWLLDEQQFAATMADMVSIALVQAERHEVECALERARDQALRASRVKSEFLATISHEIRTPMNGVLGMLSLLQETALDAGQRWYLQTALNSAEAMLELINGILDFSRIEAGRVELESVVFDVHALLREVCDLFGGRARDKGVDLTCRIAPDVPRLLRSDPTRLRQVLNNLVGNAVKFTDQGRIGVDLAVDQANGDELLLVFHVRDTGIGIAPEARERIFEPFSQADGSTTREYGGTGLGLSISRQLLELMGGSIQVESEPGKGSVFTGRFRARAAPHEQDKAHPVTTPSGPQTVSSLPETVVSDPPETDPDTATTGYRVLVVEDNEVNRQVALSMLGRLGLRHDVARNGQEALDRLAEGDFDLVLMDCHMPVMDGYAATRAYREKEDGDEWQRLPIIAMTAHAQPGERRKCLLAGMDDYLAKPVRITMLEKVLRRWLPDRSDQVRAGPIVTGQATLTGHLVDDLFDLMGREGMEELVDAFGHDADARVRDMRRAVEAGDRDALIHLAHALKGSSGNIGAGRLEQASRELERLARENDDATRWRDGLEQVESAWRLTQAALQNLERQPFAPGPDSGL